MSPAALIFDVDGTLAETEELHRAAFNAAFADAGLGWHWTRDLYRRLLKVTGGKERIAAWCVEIRTPLPPARIAALHADKTRRYSGMMATGRIALRPGVARLMAEARTRGVALAVATTTTRANVEALTRAVWSATAAEIFEVVAAGDEVAAKKPAPDVYRLALERLGIAADAALAFEDSRNGLLSARGAGLRTIVTPSVYTSGEDFSGAFVLLPDLADYHPFAAGKVVPAS